MGFGQVRAASDAAPVTEVTMLRTIVGPALRSAPEPHLLAALWRWADVEPDRPLLSTRSGDDFVSMSASVVRDRVEAIAAGIIALGVLPGERVILLARTRLEWVLFDHAILAAGAVTVPIYDTASADQVAAILDNSGARVAIVEDTAARDLVRDAASKHRGLDHLLVIDEQAIERLVEEGIGRRCEVVERLAAIESDHLAAVLYSSGTTGEPKGCELTHANLCSNVRQTVEQVPELFQAPARTLAFLPLAHALGRMQVHTSIDQGVEVAFASGLDRLPEELAMVRPTFLVAVPRVFEKVLAGAKARAVEAGRGAIFDRAMDLARRESEARRGGGRLGLVAKVQHRLFDRLVYGRIRAALGGEVRLAICGGAALDPAIGHRFDGMGLTILEGYGTTEASPIVTGGPVSPLRIGTVGRPYPATTVGIADDGEILVHGPQVFRGYRNDPEATTEALEDGWLRTGDLGDLTPDGHLRIVGRKKDILVTAGGKNVVPGPLEDRLRADPLVEECVVAGEGRPYVSALLWLDPVETTRLLGGGSPQTVGSSGATALRERLDLVVEEVNRSVSRAEAIRRYVVVDEPLTLESGMVTPTTKVRRRAVLEHFADRVDRLYADR
jgi:long-chain acyl-CoA synthetase